MSSSKSKLSRPSKRPSITTPANEEPASSKPRYPMQRDRGKDYGEPSYRRSTEKQGSLFQGLFTKVGLERSNEQCEIYWERLRTQNFQTAGTWLTGVFFPDNVQSMRGKSMPSAKSTRKEIQLKKWTSSYLQQPLSQCNLLSPKETAARYVTFIIEQEGQDTSSFFHDLPDNSTMVDFVSEMLASCKFNSGTWGKNLTKILFRTTRQADWRKRYLYGDLDCPWKERSDITSAEDRDSDSEIGDSTALNDRHQETDLEESPVISAEPPSKRAKTQQDVGQSGFSRRLASLPAVESPLAIVVPCSDTLPHQLISPAPMLSVAESAIKGISKPHESDLASATEPKSTPTSGEVTRMGGYITTSAGLPTPHASHESPYPLDQSDNLGRSPEESPTGESSNGSGSFPMTIMSRPKFDGLQAEVALAKTRNAELERTIEKQETTIQRLKKRTEEQDDEISEDLQKIKELEDLRNQNDDLLAKKVRQFAENLEYLKKQHNRSLAEKDVAISSLMAEISQNDFELSGSNQSITEMTEKNEETARHGVEREQWILNMEQDAKKNDQAVRLLHQEVVAKLLAYQRSDDESSK